MKLISEEINCKGRRGRERMRVMGFPGVSILEEKDQRNKGRGRPRPEERGGEGVGTWRAQEGTHVHTHTCIHMHAPCMHTHTCMRAHTPGRHLGVARLLTACSDLSSWPALRQLQGNTPTL